MAVRDGFRRRGIGGRLIGAGVDACQALGAGALVVLGHARYYPRFGFEPACGFGLSCEYDVPDEAFMALELAPEYLSSKSGLIRYHESFAKV